MQILTRVVTVHDFKLNLWFPLNYFFFNLTNIEILLFLAEIDIQPLGPF